MKLSLLLAVMFFLIYSYLESQNTFKNDIIGGPCEGCEAIYENGDSLLTAVDTLPQFMELPNPIKISGVVYHSDGKTPAKGVIIYVYHTNDKGKYPTLKTSKNWEKRHGYLRGWLKTDTLGRYTIFTSRPASYPNSTAPQHIHITVKEPDINEYYIEDFYFKDDPYITEKILMKKHPRGGSGVISLKLQNKLQAATRDIILGLNIPNY